MEAGLAEGASIAAGGRRTAGLEKGFFYDPTVLVDCRNDMRVCREEIFGLVLTVITYSGEDEAIRLANDSIYGLSGGVVTSNVARGFNVARQIRTGKVGVVATGAHNAATTGPGQGQGPGWGPIPAGAGISGAFGGYKQSGVGREWGRAGLEEFTELKWISWADRARRGRSTMSSPWSYEGKRVAIVGCASGMGEATARSSSVWVPRCTVPMSVLQQSNSPASRPAI